MLEYLGKYGSTKIFLCYVFIYILAILFYFKLKSSIVIMSCCLSTPICVVSVCCLLQLTVNVLKF